MDAQGLLAQWCTPALRLGQDRRRLLWNEALANHLGLRRIAWVHNPAEATVRLYATLFPHSAEAIVITDTDNRNVATNKAMSHERLHAGRPAGPHPASAVRRPDASRDPPAGVGRHRRQPRP